MLKIGSRRGSTMCSLAMSFLFAYYPLLLLWLYLLAFTLCFVCLYFVPWRGCFIAANLGLSLITAVRTATMATSTALRTIVEGVRFIFLAALRQGTAMCYNVSTALRTIVETMTFIMVAAISQIIMMAMRNLISARAYLLSLVRCHWPRPYCAMGYGLTTRQQSLFVFVWDYYLASASMLYS